MQNNFTSVQFFIFYKVLSRGHITITLCGVVWGGILKVVLV